MFHADWTRTTVRTLRYLNSFNRPITRLRRRTEPPSIVHSRLIWIFTHTATLMTQPVQSVSPRLCSELRKRTTGSLMVFPFSRTLLQLVTGLSSTLQVALDMLVSPLLRGTRTCASSCKTIQQSSRKPRQQRRQISTLDLRSKSAISSRRISQSLPTGSTCHAASF